MREEKLKIMLIQAKFDHELCKEKEREIGKILNEIKRLSKIINESDNQHIIDLCNQKREVHAAKIKEEEEKIMLCSIRKNEIDSIINTVEHPYCIILYMRYISFYDFKKIAQMLNFSDKRIYQLHKIGLQMLSKLLDD